MKNALLLLLISFSICKVALAGEDTMHLYFNKDWEDCKKDTATYYTIAYKTGKVWDRKDYWASTNKIQMQGFFKKKDFKTKVGAFVYYYESGSKKSESNYNNDGEIETEIHYYENGKKKAEVKVEEGETIAKGWDEDGKLIPHYIYEREAKYPGGRMGWSSFLENNLNADVASNSGAAVGQYKVVLQFIVNKEGFVENIEAVERPSNCIPCVIEALRVMSYSPRWIPAIQFNKPVLYRAKQPIIFQVVK